MASLFVQGGNSNYNKVIVDGVTVNEPGGTFNFGTLPLTEADSLEFMRGAQSTLYGSDAMTSVVQVSTRTGSTETPELRFGADGGNFSTANGYASVAGAHSIFDYNVFADQFNTSGQGVNNEYSNSLQGGNIGVKLNDVTSLRLRVRHSNSFSGVSDEWNFNGGQIIPPDRFEYNRLNSLLAGLTLTVNAPSGWQHQFTGFEYRYRSNNADPGTDGWANFTNLRQHQFRLRRHRAHQSRWFRISGRLFGAKLGAHHRRLPVRTGKWRCRTGWRNEFRPSPER